MPTVKPVADEDQAYSPYLFIIEGAPRAISFYATAFRARDRFT